MGRAAGPQAATMRSRARLQVAIAVCAAALVLRPSRQFSVFSAATLAKPAPAGMLCLSQRRCSPRLPNGVAALPNASLEAAGAATGEYSISWPLIAAIVSAAAASSAAQLSRAFGDEELATGSKDEFFGSQRWIGRTVGIAAVWMVFATYAFTQAPGLDAASKAADQATIFKIISTPYSGSVPPFFEAVFNSLGIWPIIFAATLLPGANRQAPVPAWPFVGGSFFLGAFALSPYLALREYRGAASNTTTADLDWPTKNIFESRWNAVLLLAGGLFLWLYAFGNGAIGTASPADAWVAFLPLFMTSQLTHVSCMDFVVLWMFYAPVLLEDGRRRGVFMGSLDVWPAAEKSLFLLCAGLPLFGGGAWLLFRPELQQGEDS